MGTEIYILKVYATRVSETRRVIVLMTNTAQEGNAALLSNVFLSVSKFTLRFFSTEDNLLKLKY